MESMIANPVTIYSHNKQMRWILRTMWCFGYKYEPIVGGIKMNREDFDVLIKHEVFETAKSTGDIFVVRKGIGCDEVIG